MHLAVFFRAQKRRKGSTYKQLQCSGTALIRTPLGPSIHVSGRIIEVSSFQGLLKYGVCGLLL